MVLIIRVMISVSDPDLIGSIDPDLYSDLDPHQLRQKNQEKNRFYVLPNWTFSLSGRLTMEVSPRACNSL
jgi:hypothetical protein